MTQFTKLTHLTESMFNTAFTKVAAHSYPEPDVSDLLGRNCSLRCVYLFLLHLGHLSNTSSP
jgi:hypothetical protein